MSDFKTRVIEEKAQLDEKIEKLKAFQNSDRIDSVSTDHQFLLSMQVLAMQQYTHILDMRLQLLEKGV
jgi:hypothetical protein